MEDRSLAMQDLPSPSSRLEETSSFGPPPSLHERKGGSESQIILLDDDDKKSVTTAHGSNIRETIVQRKGAAAVAGLVLLVFLLNAGTLIGAAIKYGATKGVVTLKSGDCKSLERANTWVHLVINLLGTALLGGSNYYMQLLSAPTRKELDRAHQSGKWLDIGVPSLRNLWYISGYRRAGWMLLAISSLPLHLFYNSTVFTQTRASDYKVFVVAEAFTRGGPLDKTYVGYNGDSVEWPNVVDLQWLHDNIASLDNLTTQECVQTYAQGILTRRGNVLAVAKADKEHPQDVVWSSATYQSWSGDAYPWLCNKPSDPGKPCTLAAAQALKPWKVMDREIEYCLSHSFSEECNFQYSSQLLLIVVVCNLIKFVAMVVMLLKVKETTLVTLGDFLTEYLQKPDGSTQNMCLPALELIKRGRINELKRARQWDSRRRFWFAAASKPRWVFCYAGSFVALTTSTVILCKGFTAGRFPSDHSLAQLAKLGFGQVQVSTLIDSEREPRPTLINSVLLANTPQLLISMLYFLYNGIFTSELLGKEWNEFSHRRRTLRVSRPRGEQRSSYRLTLPYRYGLPLMSAAFMLHWLVSRALFLVDMKFMDPIEIQDPGYPGFRDAGIKQEDLTTTFSVCGWSPLAVILSIIASSLVVIVGLLFGLRRYRAGIPLVGSCSMAIAATCHPECDEALDFFLHPIQWGVTSYRENGVGHCTFSGKPVKAPERDVIYQ